ncbi:MAG: hypothetical protein AAFU85_11540 [Planctomycetota bacterium]
MAAKKYPFETLTGSAGKHTFSPGRKVMFGSEEATELMAAGAIKPLDPKMPDSFCTSKKGAAKAKAEAEAKAKAEAEAKAKADAEAKAKAEAEASS